MGQLSAQHITVMLSIIILSVIMLSVIMLSVSMLSVSMLSVIILNVEMLIRSFVNTIPDKKGSLNDGVSSSSQLFIGILQRVLDPQQLGE